MNRKFFILATIFNVGLGLACYEDIKIEQPQEKYLIVMFGNDPYNIGVWARTIETEILENGDLRFSCL